MSSNTPDPTRHESGDNDVAEARHVVMEWLGNCYPVQDRSLIFVDRSPLALGLFVVACLYGVREEDFTATEYATMEGEVARDKRAREALEELREHVDTDNDPEALVGAGPMVDNSTFPVRQYVADSLTRHDVMNIDWHKLAGDMSYEPADWQEFTDEHDGRGCANCLNDTCMVGYEDADYEDDGDGDGELPQGMVALEPCEGHGAD